MTGFILKYLSIHIWSIRGLIKSVKRKVKFYISPLFFVFIKLGTSAALYECTSNPKKTKRLSTVPEKTPKMLLNNNEILLIFVVRFECTLAGQ